MKVPTFNLFTTLIKSSSSTTGATKLKHGAVVLTASCLLLLACAGLAFILPTVQAQQQEEQSLRMPSLISPVPTAKQTKAPPLLPSQRYGWRVDPKEVDHLLESLAADANRLSEPNQIGINRWVDVWSDALGRTFTTPDGSRVRVFALTSPGALGLRVHLEDFNLPAGDEVYLYGLSDKESLQDPYAEKGLRGEKDFWTGTIGGDTVVVEHYMKGDERPFRISEISHLYGKVQHNEPTPNVLSCHRDASCTTNAEKNAVARITYIKDSGSFVCTGTLLTNRRADFTPYFLTANHCLSTQASARTVEAYWFYQTAACNSANLRGDIVRTIQGADLLATDRSADSTLLRMVDNAPAGTVFSGWDPNPRPLSTSVHGFHHPAGDSPPNPGSHLRRADGLIMQTNNVICPATGLANGYFIDWTSGLTEQG
ncbi:MAG: trypsin-like serine peptidase, partial [Pyrinomonadaceae bacterium]